jgi:ABC-type bacteriocin/lantibiotic exporter with double-glycine peptidase domain
VRQTGVTILSQPSIAYLRRLLAFCLQAHPVMLANLFLAGLSVVLEMVAIASILPLTLLAAGNRVPPDSAWVRLFEAIGLQLTLASSLLFFSTVFALRLLTQFMNQATSISLGKSIQADLSSRAFGTVVKDMSFREIDSRSSGYFISLAGDETARAGTIIVTFNQLIAATLLAAVYFVAMFYFSILLGIGITAFLVVVALSLRSMLSRIQRLSSTQLQEAKIAHSIFLDALNGLRSVRALSAESFVTRRYEDIIRKYTTTNFRLEVLGYASRLLPALVLLACIAGITAAGYLNIESASAIALVVTALACLLRFFPAAGQVLTLLIRLLTDLRAASDVTRLLDMRPPSEAGPRRSIAGKLKMVELHRVSFAYAPSQPVLCDFSARLVAGRSYAVVGPSGSGKTTVFDLLLGFYAPEGGDILIDGVPLRSIDSKELRSHIVLIGQQVAILNDTIANNVRFGYPATEDQVRAACSAVCIDTYVESLPMGYETVLSFQGANLSGGQRQRIAIARGLLREPDILLLDESTTGLDVDVRDRVVKNILTQLKAGIVVFSTHDRDVVSQVDEVIQLSSSSPGGDGEVARNAICAEP